MRAFDRRAKAAPPLDIVTVIESAVPCTFGGETGHRLRFCVDGAGHVKELHSRCPRDPDFLDGVERLGGFCCCQTLDKFMEYVLGHKDYAGRWGEPNESLGIPPALKNLLKKARENIEALRARRLREAGENKPPVTLRLLPGLPDFPRDRVIRIAQTTPLVKRAMRAASGMDLQIYFKSDYQGVDVMKMDVDGDPRDAWILKVGYHQIARRDWGKRGWWFDEVELRKRAIPMFREDVFIDPRENRWNSRIPQCNTYCAVCKKTVNARALGSHARTVRHADNVMNRLYKAMKTFPGPRKRR